MDFARKQLEKYGWTDGKGLGKNENGISEALKPKLKRSVAGIGHDAASEFNEHWWTALYDKAAGNVEVKDKNGTTKKIKTKEDFRITNNVWQITQNHVQDRKELYSEFFVHTAVMGGGNMTKNDKDTSPEAEIKTKDVFKMTDEELFAACEGRTAHKGARHGLTASGKLARIAEQERLLLSQSRYNGYSHVKKRKEEIKKVVDELHFHNEDVSNNCCKKKKKKRNHCFSNENRSSELVEPGVEKVQEPLEIKRFEEAVNNLQENGGRKKKSKNKDRVVEFDNSVDINDVAESTKKKKKRKNDVSVEVAMEIGNVDALEEIKTVRKKKKKKIKSIE